MIKKADIILSASILVLAIASVFIFAAFKKEGGTVRISVNNEIYGEYQLDTEQTIKLPHNTVEVKDEKVYVSSADCRDQICVNKGWITAEGESIVCLPNSVVVEVR